MSRWPAIAHPATCNTHRPHGEYPGTIWARVMEKRRIMRKIMYAIAHGFRPGDRHRDDCCQHPRLRGYRATAPSSVHGRVTASPRTSALSQEILTGGVNLDLSVPNKVAAYSRLTFKAANTTNPQEDFEYFEPRATATTKLIEYAPRGDASGLCVTRLEQRRPAGPEAAARRRCVAGQQWTAIDPGDRQLRVGCPLQRARGERPEPAGLHPGHAGQRRICLHLRPVGSRPPILRPASLPLRGRAQP